MKLFRTTQRLTPKEKLNILFAAYSSLTDFSKRRVGPCAIAKKLSMRQSTVSTALLRFEMCKRDVARFV